MTTTTKPYRDFSFDGHGINGSDEYRTRLATLTEAGHREKVGPLLATSRELLATCEALCDGIDELMGRLAKDAPELLPARVDIEPWATILKARAAIAKAKVP